MSSLPETPKRALLIGAGHAHLYTLKRAEEFARRGYELIAVAPDRFWYSGLATGVLGGRYAPEEDQVEVAALVHAGGASCRFIRDRLVSLDPVARTASFQSGAQYSYDVLSLNLGSEVRAFPGETEGVFSIKPLRNLWTLRQELEAARADGVKPRVVVAGGGASGCEIAANVRALLGLNGGEITILAGGERMVPSFPEGAARRLARWLRRREIQILRGASVASVEPHVVVTEKGERIDFDFLVNATGLHPPEILRELGQKITPAGELVVDEYLRSTSDPRIFGGGDCVALRGHELAKIGVYAIREAPVLFHNLLATLDGEPLREFHPQRHFLLILNLGGGVGLARWRCFWWLGRAAFWLKDSIDRRFLARYRDAS